MEAFQRKMLVYLKREPGSEKLKYGDVVLICASPTAIEGPQNPEEFDYRKWLDRQGIHAQVYAVRDEWKIISRKMVIGLKLLRLTYEVIFLINFRVME